MFTKDRNLREPSRGEVLESLVPCVIIYRPEKEKCFLVYKLHMCYVTTTNICCHSTNAVTLLREKFRRIGSNRTCFIATFRFYDVMFVWFVKYTNGKKKIGDMIFLKVFSRTFQIYKRFDSNMMILQGYKSTHTNNSLGTGKL